MKSKLLNVLLMLVILILSNDKSNAQAFGENINIIHLGVGFISHIENSDNTPANPSTFVDTENYSPQILPISLCYERGITNHFSVGGYLAYESYDVTQNMNTYQPFPYGNAYYLWSWHESLMIFAARGSLHFWTSQHFDPYIGLMLGYQFDSKSNSASDNASYLSPANSSSGSTGFGGYLGMNCYFSDNFGIYSEISYGIVSAALNFGLSYRF